MAEKLPLQPGKSRAEFKRALTALASDQEFRTQAIKDPRLVTRKFKLSLTELESLREVAILSGADITAVNKIRANEIASRATTAALKRTTIDIDISCCSCCCCCCGETGVASVMYSVT
jgi:hypothetical protein